MATKLDITVADKVFAEIELRRGNIGRSEFVEELIRDGLKILSTSKGGEEEPISKSSKLAQPLNDTSTDASIDLKKKGEEE